MRKTWYCVSVIRIILCETLCGKNTCVETTLRCHGCEILSGRGVWVEANFIPAWCEFHDWLHGHDQWKTYTLNILIYFNYPSFRFLEMVIFLTILFYMIFKNHDKIIKKQLKINRTSLIDILLLSHFLISYQHSNDSYKNIMHWNPKSRMPLLKHSLRSSFSSSFHIYKRRTCHFYFTVILFWKTQSNRLFS